MWSGIHQCNRHEALSQLDSCSQIKQQIIYYVNNQINKNNLQNIHHFYRWNEVFKKSYQCAWFEMNSFWTITWHLNDASYQIHTRKWLPIKILNWNVISLWHCLRVYESDEHGRVMLENLMLSGCTFVNLYFRFFCKRVLPLYISPYLIRP